MTDDWAGVALCRGGCGRIAAYCECVAPPDPDAHPKTL